MSSSIVFETMRGSKLTRSSDSIIVEPLNPIINNVMTWGSSNNISRYFSIKGRLRTSEVLKIVYVLPVEAQGLTSFGNGIDLIKQMFDDGEIEDNVLFVQPDFKHVPWYANHPTNMSLQQENNMISFFNFINDKYSNFEIETYLLGFSKSGWGPMNLLLNHPQYIDGVLIWDAPLAVNSILYSDMLTIFGNETYLKENYFLNDILVEKNINLLGKKIVISGYNLFSSLSNSFINVLNNYPEIIYTHDSTLNYSHAWNKLWVRSLLYHLDNVLKP